MIEYERVSTTERIWAMRGLSTPNDGLRYSLSLYESIRALLLSLDGTDRSTRVNVHQQFNGADVANMRLLLFDHSKQVCRVRIQDGRITDIQLEDN